MQTVATLLIFNYHVFSWINLINETKMKQKK